MSVRQEMLQANVTESMGFPQKNVQSEAAVVFTDVVKRFGKKEAVCNFSLVLNFGKITGLIGPNGAGKSTLLKLILGVLRPTEGVVRTLGHDPFRHQALIKSLCGYVPETHQIYRWMTVSEVLRFCSALYQSWDVDLEQMLVDVFKLSGGIKVQNLSRGMLAKLALAIALSHRPKLLLLDEPISGLDPIARDEFIDIAIRSKVSGQTILFSSHQLDEVAEHADEVVVVSGGRILLHRPTKELIQTARKVTFSEGIVGIPAHHVQGDMVVLKDRSTCRLVVMDYRPELLDQWARQRGVTIVTVEPATLDDVFKAVIRREQESNSQCS